MKSIIIIVLMAFSYSLLITGCNKDVMPELQEGLGESTTNLSEPISNKIILASGEWSPYVSENLEHEGVVSRIVREAFAFEDIEVEYVYLPWKRSMEGSKIGKWHGTFPWLKNEERIEHFYFSDPIAQENVLFFHKKSLDFDWEMISDLDGYKIGGTTGYFYGDEFDRAEKEGKIIIERTSEDTQNFQKLAAGRVSIVIAEIDVGYNIIENIFSQEEAKDFTHHPRSISANPLYLLFSKQVGENGQLIELFNKGLKQLEESGKIALYWEESRRGDYKNK